MCTKGRYSQVWKIFRTVSYSCEVSHLITHPLFFIYNMSQLTLLAYPQLICLCNYYAGRSGWKALQLHLAAAAAVVAYRKHPLVAWWGCLLASEGSVQLVGSLIINLKSGSKLWYISIFWNFFSFKIKALNSCTSQILTLFNFYN